MREWPLKLIEDECAKHEADPKIQIMEFDMSLEDFFFECDMIGHYLWYEKNVKPLHKQLGVRTV